MRSASRRSKQNCTASSRPWKAANAPKTTDWKLFAERFGLIGAWILIILFLGYYKPEQMFAWNSYATMFGSNAMVVVLTLALMIPLTTGDFDLSVASVMGLTSMLIAVLNVRMGVDIVPAIMLALDGGRNHRCDQRFLHPVFRRAFPDRHVGNRLLHQWRDPLGVQLGDHFGRVDGIGEGGHPDAGLRHPDRLLLRARSHHHRLVRVPAYQPGAAPAIRGTRQGSGAAFRRQCRSRADRIADRIGHHRRLRRRALHRHARLCRPVIGAGVSPAGIRCCIPRLHRHLSRDVSMRLAPSWRCSSSPPASWGSTFWASTASCRTSSTGADW